MDAETAARQLVTELLTGATERVAAVFAPPETASLRLPDGIRPSSTAELRAYFDRLADRYTPYEIGVNTVLVDGDTAVVRWQLAVGGDVKNTVLTEVMVGADGITTVVGGLAPAAVLPASTRVGLTTAAQTTDDPVVVLAPDDAVVAVNDAAIETFGRDRAAVLGRSVETLLGPVPAFEAGEESLVAGPAGRRVFEVRVSAVGFAGEPTGGHPPRATKAPPSRAETADRVLVARDVTERRRRTQQLSVLVRVLRHNVRNDLDVIRSHIDVARRQADDAVAETLSPAVERTAALVATADTANTIRSLTATPDHHTVDLVAVARRAADRARESFDDTTVVCEAAVETAEVSVAEGFGRAVWELVENAHEHGGSTVRLSVTRHGQFQRLAVDDDGPGIPNDERMVLNRATETSLEHGSGLGLWLTKWLVDASGGALTFAVDDGTIARIDLFDGDRAWPSESNS
jgi:signal transduction histidine kinase